MRMKLAAAAFAVVCIYPLTAMAPDSAELLARMKATEKRIKSLEAEVQSLKAQQAVAPAPTVAQTTPAAPAEISPLPRVPVSLGGAGGAAAKVLNLDIALIGAFLGAAGDGAGLPLFAFSFVQLRFRS